MKARTAALLAAAPVAAVAAYLLAWPTGVEPVAWTPPPAPPLEGPYAYNDKLKAIQRLLDGVGTGPEAIVLDAFGRLYTGYADGTLIYATPDAAGYVVIANTGGRPLGVTLGPQGGLVIADAAAGLLEYNRKLKVIAREAGGMPFRLTDDVTTARTAAKLYFTDASHKFPLERYRLDILEHGANGRLLEFDEERKQTRVLLADLHFANGVAVGPDDQYVLVSETAEYRVVRYWLKGEKAGTHEVFIDNLPGFPDNITFNGRDCFWLALASPRDPMLDGLLPGSLLLRRVIARLPQALQPNPKMHAFVLGLGLDGKVVANLQYAAADAYAPITSVREHGPWLYFGSLAQSAVGRLPLNLAIADAPAPPPGSEQVPVARKIERRKDRHKE